MRQVTMVTLLVSILVLILQCSENESLNVFNGRMETVSAPDTLWYIVGAVSPDAMQDTLLVRTDSIRWVYEVPSGGSSGVSIIMSGQISGKSSIDSLNPIIGGGIIGNTDLEVETHTDSVNRYRCPLPTTAWAYSTTL